MKTNLKPARRMIALAAVLTLANAAAALVPHALPPDFLKSLSLVNLLGAIALALEALFLERSCSGEASCAAPPPPPVSREERTRHELAAFLGLLQEKGRLVDFVMEDITTQSDARVGQVARVVHQGCREVLGKHFDLQPARDEAEGALVELPDGGGTELRLVGKVPEGGPRRGVLLHAGWVSRSVRLPELIAEMPETSSRYLVAPAEIELGT